MAIPITSVPARSLEIIVPTNDNAIAPMPYHAPPASAFASGAFGGGTQCHSLCHAAHACTSNTAANVWLFLRSLLLTASDIWRIIAICVVISVHKRRTATYSSFPATCSLITLICTSKVLMRDVPVIENRTSLSIQYKHFWKRTLAAVLVLSGFHHRLDDS